MRTKQQAMKRRRTKGPAYAALLAGLGLAALLALALAPGAGSGSAPGYAAGTAAFAAGGNTFVSAASTSIGLRSAALEPLDELTPGFGRPAAAGGEGGTAAWDIGGSELVYAAPGGEAGTLGVTGSLVSADVNAAGYVAAVSLTEEELGLVTVFSPEGEELYRWHFNSAWPLAAAVSPDGEALAVLAASEQGGEVRLARLDGTEQLASYTLPGEYFFRLGWLDGGALCAVSAHRALVLDTLCGIAAERTFAPYEAADAAFGEGFAAVALSGEGGHALLTVDAAGEAGFTALPAAPLSLDAGGGYVLCLAGERALFFDSSLRATAEREAPGAHSALLRDGGALLVGRDSVKLIYV